MKIIGVEHSTFDEAKNIIPSVKPVVEKLKEQNISGNAGIEHETTEFDDNLLREDKKSGKGFERFWKAIVLRLQRRGTKEIQPIDNEKLVSFNMQLRKILDIIPSGNDYQISKTNLIAILRDNTERISQLVIPEYQTLARQLNNALIKGIERIPNKKIKATELKELWLGFNYYRSLRMFEEARKKRLDYIIVGALHASHLKNKGEVHYALRKELMDIVSDLEKGAEEDKAAYLKHREVIAEIRRALKVN